MKLPQYQEQTELSGWKGGIVWLVPTFLKIEAWKPVAERVLKRENFECGSSNI